MPRNVPEWTEFGEVPDPWEALKAGDLRGALSGFATREMLDYREDGRYHSDSWICGFGVVLWLMGDSIGAGQVWSNACDEALRGKFKYSSMGTFQPGLLLWFASVWLKDEDWHEEAAALFDKLLRKRQPVMGAGFATLLAKMLRREIELPELEAAYSSDGRRERLQSQALFYAGVRAAEGGDFKKAEPLWQQVNKPQDKLLAFEYHLLVYERKRLQARG